MSKNEKSPTPASSKESLPKKDLNKVLQASILTMHDTDSDTTEDEDDGMRVCVHCRRCFMSNGDLIPHCINTHFCDPSSFQQCLPSRYEKHNNIKTYRSLGSTIRVLSKRLALKKCKDCDKIFLCHFDYANHAEQVHSETKPYECICCSKSFDTVLNRVYHVMKAHAKRNVVCKSCGKLVFSLHYIDNHLLKCNINTYQCEKCSEDFTSQELLDSHMSKHDSNSFQCEECEMEFETKKEFIAHKKTHKKQPESKKVTERKKPPIIEPAKRSLRKRRKRKYIEVEEEDDEDDEDYVVAKTKTYLTRKIKEEREDDESDN